MRSTVCIEHCFSLKGVCPPFFYRNLIVHVWRLSIPKGSLYLLFRRWRSTSPLSPELPRYDYPPATNLYGPRNPLVSLFCLGQSGPQWGVLCVGILLHGGSSERVCDSWECLMSVWLMSVWLMSVSWTCVSWVCVSWARVTRECVSWACVSLERVSHERVCDSWVFVWLMSVSPRECQIPPMDH